MKEKLRVEVENGQVLTQKNGAVPKNYAMPKNCDACKNLDKRLQKYTGGASKI